MWNTVKLFQIENSLLLYIVTPHRAQKVRDGTKVASSILVFAAPNLYWTSTCSAVCWGHLQTLRSDLTGRFFYEIVSQRSTHFHFLELDTRRNTQYSSWNSLGWACWLYTRCFRWAAWSIVCTMGVTFRSLACIYCTKLIVMLNGPG